MPHQPPAAQPAALDIWDNAVRQIRLGKSVCIATVIDTWGSSPVPVGGQMAIFDEETFLGSVSGGCIETDVIVAAADCLKSGRFERLRFGISDETAWAAGLPCGGNIQILLQPLSGPADAEFAEDILSARRNRQTLLIKTDLLSGERTLHRHSDSLEQPFDSMLKGERSGLVSLAGHDVFALAIAPPPHLLIVGATHIAQALVAIAKTLGLTPIIIDPRESFASQSRFQQTRIMHGWPREVMERIGLDEHTSIVALAHVEHIDDEALVCALSSPARYIGALGSTRNHARRKERLLKSGISQDSINRINSPIGIDIGAVTPEEIALAIASQVVLARRGPRRRQES